MVFCKGPFFFNAMIRSSPACSRKKKMSNCLWNDLENAHRYHLANWESVAMSKEFGGMGLPNLRDLNVCLLASWIRRYSQDKDKL